MFSKKRNKLISRIPVSIRVTVWFTAVIVFLFSIVLSSAILLEDRYINNSSTEELVIAVEKIYEDPDEFENFNDGIYYIKYNENNEIIVGKIPKDFDLTLAFSIENIKGSDGHGALHSRTRRILRLLPQAGKRRKDSLYILRTYFFRNRNHAFRMFRFG